MTNVGYAGTLAKADTEQAAAIEEKLKNFNTNGNGYGCDSRYRHINKANSKEAS